MTNRKPILLSSAVLIGLLAACSNKQVKTAATAPEASPTPVPATNVTEASIRADFAPNPSLNAIHFDYDSYILKAEARGILKQNAAYLKDNPQDVRAAGYCDERGTEEYNLALGQKRAKAVRDYYIKLGVPSDSIATISYGKENPLCADHNEACWSQNRRVETDSKAPPAAPPAAAEPSPSDGQ